MAFLGIHIISSAKLNELKQQAEQFAMTEAGRAVIALQKTDIGAAVAADIKAVSSTTMTGGQKFEAVLANTLPLIVKYATGGGISAVVDDVEDIGRALVQMVFNDVKSTKAGSIGRQILKLLGL